MAYVPVPNQSVSGTVGASILGAPPANLFVGGALATTANPVPVQPPAAGFLPVTAIGSVITVSQGSVATVIIGGSIAASFTPPANQSVSGTVHVDNFSSVIAYQLAGSVLATSATVNPAANQSVSGTVHVDNFSSVVAYQLAGSVLATSATFTPPANQSVSGAVSVSNFPATQPVSGSVMTLQGTNPWIITGSVQGTFSAGNSSVQVLNFPANQSVSGTVGAAQIGSWSASVGGTVSVIGTVPVTQSGAWSVSIASAPATSVWLGTPGTPIRYSGSTVSTSVTLIAASAAGKKNYITDFWAANTGATTTLLTFKDGSTSVLGYTVVPTGGGSNSPGITTPMVTAAAQDLVFQNTSGTSILYLTVNGYQI